MDKNKKICIVIIAILVLLILLVIGMKYYNFKNSSTEVLGYNNSLSNEIQNSNTIQSGVYIKGINISGLTKDEATMLVENELKNQMNDHIELTTNSIQ